MSITQKSFNTTVLISAKNEDRPYDVFVVFSDDEETAIRGKMFESFYQNGISYCELEKHGHPGQSVFDSALQLQRLSKKILFVLSPEFASSKEMIYLAECLLKQEPSKTITLVTDDKAVRNRRLRCLRGAPTVRVSSVHWLKELIEEIRVIVPDYCQLLETGKVSDLCLLRGLCLVHFHAEIYGLLISVGSKYLKVDSEEYADHIDIHHKFKTIQACEQCKSLRDLDTTVSFVFGRDFGEVDCLSQVSEDVVQLCLGVFDMVTPVEKQIQQMLVCTASSTIVADQYQYLVEMFSDLRYYVMNKQIENSVQPEYSDLEDVEERKNTFFKSWTNENLPSVEDMAEAGFFFVEKPQLARCFSCGISKVDWEQINDPLKMHISVAPTCKYISTKITQQHMPLVPYKELVTVNTEYQALDKRIRSFDEFNFGQITDSSNHEVSFDTHDLKCEMAEAGFYFIGHGTFVKCFICGTTVFYNNIEVDPWVLHASYSPKCKHVLEMKGTEFTKTLSSAKCISGKDQTVISFFLKDLHKTTDTKWQGYVFRP